MAQVGQVAISSEIPDVLRGFYEGPEGLIQRGISEIFPGGATGPVGYEERYAPLIQSGLAGAGGVAPMSQFQEETGKRIAGMGLPSEYDLATQAGQQAALGYMTAPERFSTQAAQYYMSPYQQGVIDIQQRQAIEAARQSQLGGNLAAARQGTYGGARQALLQAQREAGLRTQLGDIQAKGLQDAYAQAQAQFERDRAAQMGSAQGLAGLTQTFGGLGTQRLAGEMDITKTMGAYGDLQRALEQQQMDAEKAYRTGQSEFGLQQVGELSNILRGIPMTSQTQTTTAPAPSFASQLTGLGLTGIGLYNLLGGG
jgi:hypothetical protein